MKRTVILVSVLALLTAVFAVLHLTGPASDTPGEVTINGKRVAVSELAVQNVSGTIINAKGEKTQIDAMGIPLSELFDCDVKVIAADSYSAVISADELCNACLIAEGDRLQLAVFGDSDSKRNVKNVAEVFAK